MRGTILFFKIFPHIGLGTTLLARLKNEGLINDPEYGNFLLKNEITSEKVNITTPDFDESEVLRRKQVIEKLFPEKHRLAKKLLSSVGFEKLGRTLYSKMKGA